MLKTLKEWRAGNKASLGDYLGFDYNQSLIVEVDKEMYWEMLECIYPNYMNSYLFQMGEPSSFIEEGETFTTFIEIRNRYFCIGDQLDLNNFKLAYPMVKDKLEKIKTSINLGVEVKESAKDLKQLINN